jgi:hypothetical protein
VAACHHALYYVRRAGLLLPPARVSVADIFQTDGAGGRFTNPRGMFETLLVSGLCHTKASSR